MPGEMVGGFLNRLARGMAAEALRGESDRELVGRLVAGPDPATFEAVVRRHGPMVYRVCRRVLRHEQDAEDAFQATFLVFARSLRTIRKPAALASWLHGVALRTARRARASAANRRRAERQAVTANAAPSDELTWGELRPVLDEELAKLPERWRLPLVLCYLEGRTQDEAAGELGWGRITLRRRLDEARAALGRRLARRGFGPAAVAAILVADCLAAGAVPPRLIADTATIGHMSASGRGAAISPQVSYLAHKVRTSMTTLIRWKLSGAALAVGMLMAGGWITAGAGPIDRAAAQDKSAPAKSSRTSTPADPKPAKTDLSGTWKLHLPAGFDHDIKLSALSGGRFRFEGKGLVFNGVYERKDGKLVMADPVDDSQTGFEWEEKEDGSFELVRNSDAMSGDYLGATLKCADAGKPEKPAAGAKPDPVVKAPAAPAGRCRVSGRLESTEYKGMDGSLERAIVYVLQGAKGFNRFVDPDTRKEAYSNSPEGTFAFDLPPGEYRVQCTGIGSRGATFMPTYKSFTVKAGSGTLDLGTIDMSASKVTKLFGKPAPEITGVAAWKNTDPLTLKGLRGKVVVIDFWSYGCSICHQQKPALIKLADRYREKGLAVITLHDDSVASVEEMDEKMEPVVKHTWKGKPLSLPIGVDGKGAKSVFQAFGVYAVPTVLLIDAKGNVVRRFPHAGDAELEKEVARLLALND